MAKRNPKRNPGPAWRTKWPRNGDLKAWFRAMIQKCDAIADAATASDRAQLPIEHLAKMGHVAEALRHVDRFLLRLPNQQVVKTVRMAKVGAKICLDTDDLARMEKYLKRVEATERFN